MRAFHDTPLASHQEYFKTHRKIQEWFAWKGMKEDVLKHIKECMVCQQSKSEQIFSAGLLQLLPIPEQKWMSKIQAYDFDIE